MIDETLIARLEALIAEWREALTTGIASFADELESALREAVRAPVSSTAPAQGEMTNEDKLFAANAILAFLCIGVCPAGFDRDDLRRFSARLLKERAIAIAREASVSPVSEGWQPIATAPTMRNVLVYWEQFETCNVLLKADDGVFFDEDGANYTTPTHWMPLPAPPASAGTEVAAPAQETE